jgi:hypothetical protein
MPFYPSFLQNTTSFPPNYQRAGISDQRVGVSHQRAPFLTSAREKLANARAKLTNARHFSPSREANS